MKKATLFLLLILITSCVSTKYNVYENEWNFDNIKAGTKYTIFDKNNHKVFLNVTSIEKDSIRGTKKNQHFAIAKSDIKEIKKNKTGATVILISTTAGLLIITYLIADTTKKVGQAFGQTIAGQ